MLVQRNEFKRRTACSHNSRIFPLSISCSRVYAAAVAHEDWWSSRCRTPIATMRLCVGNVSASFPKATHSLGVTLVQWTSATTAFNAVTWQATSIFGLRDGKCVALICDSWYTHSRTVRQIQQAEERGLCIENDLDTSLVKWLFPKQFSIVLKSET